MGNLFWALFSEFIMVAFLVYVICAYDYVDENNDTCINNRDIIKERAAANFFPLGEKYNKNNEKFILDHYKKLYYYVRKHDCGFSNNRDERIYRTCYQIILNYSVKYSFVGKPEIYGIYDINDILEPTISKEVYDRTAKGNKLNTTHFENKYLLKSEYDYE